VPLITVDFIMAIIIPYMYVAMSTLDGGAPTATTAVLDAVMPKCATAATKSEALKLAEPLPTKATTMLNLDPYMVLKDAIAVAGVMAAISDRYSTSSAASLAKYEGHVAPVGITRPPPRFE